MKTTTITFTHEECILIGYLAVNKMIYPKEHYTKIADSFDKEIKIGPMEETTLLNSITDLLIESRKSNKTDQKGQLELEETIKGLYQKLRPKPYYGYINTVDPRLNDHLAVNSQLQMVVVSMTYPEKLTPEVARRERLKLVAEDIYWNAGGLDRL